MQATLANDKQHAIEAQGQRGTPLRIPAADNAPLDASGVRVRRLHDTFREALQPDRIDLARDTAATFGPFHRVEARRRLLHPVTLHRPPLVSARLLICHSLGAKAAYADVATPTPLARPLRRIKRSIIA